MICIYSKGEFLFIRAYSKEEFCSCLRLCASMHLFLCESIHASHFNVCLIVHASSAFSQGEHGFLEDEFLVEVSLLSLIFKSIKFLWCIFMVFMLFISHALEVPSRYVFKYSSMCAHILHDLFLIIRFFDICKNSL